MEYADRFFQKSTYIIDNFKKMIFNSSELRIINFLKSLARDYGHEINDLPGIKSIPIQLTYFEIANLTGTTPNKVKYVIKSLKTKGIVRYSDKKFLLKF